MPLEAEIGGHVRVDISILLPPNMPPLLQVVDVEATEATVVWPVNNPSEEVAAYHIEFCANGRWQVLEEGLEPNSTDGVMRYLMCNMDGNTSHQISVSAINGAGASEAKVIGFKTGPVPPNEPGRPECWTELLDGTAAPAMVWNPPSNNGGAQIQAYEVEVFLDRLKF